MAEFATSDCATMLSTVKDSSCSTARPVSNVTPRRITGVRSGVNRITQPFASTRLPGGVPGHLSLVSSTPSPSESLKRWQPVLSTSVPGGVPGHLSIPSGTPSLSESSGHPAGAAVHVDRGAERCVGAGIPLVGDPVVVLVLEHPRTGEDRQAERAHHMTRPVGAGEAATGGVDAADFDAQRRAITQKQPFADRAVHRVVGEAVRRRLLEIEAGVPTEEVEQVACVSEIEAETRAAERQRRRCGPRAGAKVLVTDVELGADDFGEEVAQACAAAHAALEAEHLV